MALELWLIRHGQTDWNAEKRIQGQLDSSLSALGVAQAERLAERLKGEKFDTVYASDAGRARQTAAIALPETDPHLDTRLREIHFGVLEGKTREEFTPAESAMWAQVTRDRYNYAPAGGETWQQHIERIGDWLDSLPSSGRVVAFSHGGTVRAAVFYVIGHYPIRYDWNFSFSNTGITRFHFSEEQRQILSVNDAAHLTGLTSD